MDLWNSWVAMSLLSAAAWGLSCVIDVCFVGEGIYRKPEDGLLTAGLFCAVPFLIFSEPGVTNDVDTGVVAVALLSGIFYLLHVYFYFTALFALNDASNAEIFNTLSVLVVPVLAFLMLGELLPVRYYIAIGICVLGILVLIRFQLSTLTWQVAVLLGTSVLFVSLVMVMQAWVLQFVAYETAVSLFSFSAFVAVAALLVARARLRRRLMVIVKRIGLLLLVVECLELAAVFGSQRATDVGPSVSLVALLECSLPIFVMVFSGIFLGASRYWQKAGMDGVRAALASQTDAYPAKLFSLALIVMAISLVHQ